MTLAAATRLGPYEILSPLGAGGMGEVYRARDPRLGREVAVKVLPEAVATDPDRLRRFEHEAKAVAALNHPNILTVHDVGTHDGSPYVVTELLEGETLRDVLTRRTPTPRQVLSWGLQAAQGLAAAHQKGIVHRDIKPENLFLTTDGRLKILDFGLAKLVALGGTDTAAATASGPSQAGVVVGTVAYMSPEQVGAEPLDHRSDLFSLGIFLYELLSREHPFRRSTVAATLSAILHEEPPEPSTRQAGISPPMDRIVRRCLEKRREERYQSAHDLALALKAALEGGSPSATLRDVEERSPYPGLSAFTEDDAGRFFGREEEVANLWNRLRDRRLLAVIGPSGAGKSSFVRAGVVAGRPDGWDAVVAKPGASPFRGLGQVLAPHVVHDPEALGKLVAFEDPETAFELLTRWRRSHDEALVVIDQFEELFTQNTPEVQERFAALLGRLAGEADVHVLLSMRDDFLMGCHGQPALSPVFESLTPLGPMTREGLRRALVEPAARRGYRFEDAALVEEMIDAVEGARSALPLLAFAVSRLWEKRKPAEKLLTREAYVEVGGVAGALARHAEETMERIGAGLEGTVREIFRNLTTAQGTRAALDREELLSALPDRATAEPVLSRLIDARLLTSWETDEAEGRPPRRRIEIVHESLLSAWPRLVRWQTQDADGTQLRDQLRQAAHLWAERGKAEELLWTGTSFLDYRLWRARYPGKLSSLEEEFSVSMAEKAERTKRRRRVAVGSVVVALVAGLAVLAFLWNRSEVQKRQAQAAGRRAEASKLLALAQLEVEADPTAALAYTTKSLELDDTQVARFFALRILQESPVANVVGPNDQFAGFSPDGEWLAVLQGDSVVLLNQDGRAPVVLPVGGIPPGPRKSLAFGPDGRTVVLGLGSEGRILSVPDGREVRRVKYEKAAAIRNSRCGWVVETDGNRRSFFVRPWDGSPERLVGAIELPAAPRTADFAGDLVAWALGRSVSLRSISRWGLGPRLLGEHPSDVTCVELSGDGRRVASVDRSGELRLWDADGTTGQPLRILPAPANMKPSGSNLVFFNSERWIVSDTMLGGRGVLRLWDLEASRGAEPVVLRSKTVSLELPVIDPLGRALSALEFDVERRLSWILPRSRPLVFESGEGQVLAAAFTADGATLVGATIQGHVRAWPLSAESAIAFRVLPKANEWAWRIAASPVRREVVVASASGRIQMMPVDGGPARELEGLSGEPKAGGIAISPDGRRAAAAPSGGPAKEKRIHVWDLQTGASRTLDPVPNADDGSKGAFGRLAFVDDDRIVAGVKDSGLMLFDLRDGKGTVLSPAVIALLAPGRGGRTVYGLVRDPKEDGCGIVRVGLDGGAPVRLPGQRVCGPMAIDPNETLVASKGPDESIQLSSISGGEPHLLFGHRGDINSLAFSPDGRWIASAGDDQTVRLWPVPDVTQVPPHRRSHDEFLATLKSFTNVRAVPDPKSSTGWKLEPGPFPGWKDAPHW